MNGAALGGRHSCRPFKSIQKGLMDSNLIYLIITLAGLMYLDSRYLVPAKIKRNVTVFRPKENS